MDSVTPLGAVLMVPPQDELDGPEERPDVAEMLGEQMTGTLGPEFEPDAFDAAILGRLVSP